MGFEDNQPRCFLIGWDQFPVGGQREIIEFLLFLPQTKSPLDSRHLPSMLTSFYFFFSTEYLSRHARLILSCSSRPRKSSECIWEEKEHFMEYVVKLKNKGVIKQQLKGNLLTTGALGRHCVGIIPSLMPFCQS